MPVQHFLVAVAVAVLCLAPSAPAGPLDQVEQDQSYVGDLVNKTTVITDNSDTLDINQEGDRDKIRRTVATRTINYANDFVKNFDPGKLAEQLARIFPPEYVNKFPGEITKFIGSLDAVELDDYFASVDNKEKSDLDRIKMAYVVKSLAEHAPPPGGPGGHGSPRDELVPTIPAGSLGDNSAFGDKDFRDRMRTYEDGYQPTFKYQVPPPNATDKDRDAGGEGAVKETTNNFEDVIPEMVKIAQSQNGLANSRTSNWWRNLQGAGVEKASGAGDGNKTMVGNDQFGSDAFQGTDGTWWRVKPDWWVHRHEDGTIRSFAQDATAAFDPYRPPALLSGAQLLSTELKIFESGDALACDMGKFRSLVCNAEQKILFVDYEHFPKGMVPGKISEGLWAALDESGKPVTVEWFDPSLVTPAQQAAGIGMDQHTQPDGTAAPTPVEEVVASDHPRGNTADGTGNWDQMIIRAVYWKDLQIPIYEYNLSYAAGGVAATAADEEKAPKVKSEEVVLKMEKEVDAYDTPPDLVTYVVPPLLEPPLPPTTFTRNEYPLGVSYSGMGGK